MNNKEMAEFLLKLRDRREMPIDEKEYDLLREISERLQTETVPTSMDKDIPTLVVKHDNDGLVYGRCPRCGKMMDNQRYCGNCGQAVIHVSPYGQKPDQDFGTYHSRG